VAAAAPRAPPARLRAAPAAHPRRAHTMARPERGHGPRTHGCAHNLLTRWLTSRARVCAHGDIAPHAARVLAPPWRCDARPGAPRARSGWQARARLPGRGGARVSTGTARAGPAQRCPEAAPPGTSAGRCWAPGHLPVLSSLHSWISPDSATEDQGAGRLCYVLLQDPWYELLKTQVDFLA